MVDICKRNFQQFVCYDRTGISKPKKRVISEDSPKSHCLGVNDGLLPQHRESLKFLIRQESNSWYFRFGTYRMGVNNSNLLPDENITKQRKGGDDGWEWILVIESCNWKIVHLQYNYMKLVFPPVIPTNRANLKAVCQISDPSSVAIGMCNHNYLNKPRNSGRFFSRCNWLTLASPQQGTTL